MARVALVSALAGALLAGPPALAEEALVGIAVRAKDRVFLSLDRDRDGAISRPEATQHPGIVRNFAGADEDRDGRLTPVEFSRIPFNRIDQPGWSTMANRA